MVLRSWMQYWNDIICDVIFPDEELMSLMKIPAGTDIVTFTDRYFIRAGYTTKTLTNESVRIVYGNTYSTTTNNPMVMRNQMSFDIYVKLEDMRNATNNRLMLRTVLIADRLNTLLTKSRYNGVYRFWIDGEQDMGTSAAGYARYNISFGYLKSY